MKPSKIFLAGTWVLVTIAFYRIVQLGFTCYWFQKIDGYYCTVFLDEK